MTDIIVDIDGTLANIAHRRHYVASKPKNWKAFNAGMHLDLLHHDVASLVRTLWYMNDDHEQLCSQCRVILASGRGEENRQVTVDWLDKFDIMPDVKDFNYVYPRFPLFTYEKLYMRKAGDHRSDVIVKREILDQIRGDGYTPTIAFDDRDGVVKMWRDAGLRCFQVAEGNF